MLYELIGIARPHKGVSEIKEITRTAGQLILTGGGVIRGLTNWGTFYLPKPARKAGQKYVEGHYFILRFDASSRTQHAVRRTLGLDPRMIRYSLVSLGSKLEDIKDVKGTADFMGRHSYGLD